jgi:medium-chain acyl-[acyl-carrier-protein] hydrolase
MDILPVWNEELRVKAYETDFRNRWKPHCLQNALQEAASNHAANLGYGYVDMGRRGLAWVLTRMLIRFHAMPSMGQAVHLRTWPKGVQQRLFFTRDFALTGPDGQPIAEATSGWVLIDPAQRRILSPASLPGRLPRHEEHAVADLLEKIPIPPGLPVAGTFKAAYSSVDALGHANSGRYIEWILDSLPFEEHERRRLAWLQINYSTELRPGEEMALALGPGADSVWYAQGSILPGGTRAFDASFAWEVL